MTVNRRTFVAGALGVTLAPAVAGAQPTATPPPPAPPPPVPIMDQVAGRAANARHLLTFEGGRFGGPAWDRLLAAGRESLFFLIGEEHGIAENPKLAAALFQALVPSGYTRAVIETSPQGAFAMDRAAYGGRSSLETYLRAPTNLAAFFGMREEADWLVAARAAVPGSGPILWGIDYEIGADRRLIADLDTRGAPPAARTAIAALAAASGEGWAAYDQTHNIMRVPSFSLEPDLVRTIRSAWPNPPAATDWTLETLEETFAINGLYRQNLGYESNARRAALMRRNLLRHWRAERGPKPRVMMKMGLFHMMRGMSMTNVFDIGTLAPELAQIEGGRSFSICVLPGATSSVASLDPTNLRYVPRPVADEAYLRDLAPLYRSVLSGGFTLFETAPLRPFMSRVPASNASLARIVHGFDAVLLMPGSTASANL